jgi:hypothetical protein
LITAFKPAIGVFVKLTGSRVPIQTSASGTMAFTVAFCFVVRGGHPPARLSRVRCGMIDDGRNRLQQEA